MWWDHQNLDKPREDKAGERWHFRVWHDVVDETHVVRIFFWNDDRSTTGVVPFLPGARTHVRAIRAFLEKLLAHPELRSKHQRELRFPLERHYSRYEDLAEANENVEME